MLAGALLLERGARGMCGNKDLDPENGWSALDGPFRPG